MEAGNFWNCAMNHTKDTKEFFATRDTTKIPLAEISFAQNTKSKELPQVVKDLDTERKNTIHNNGDGEAKDEEYCSDLISLNQSVLDWIKKHVNKNPCIDLTPVIRDYEKHLGQIGEKHKARVVEKQSKVNKTPEAHPSPVVSASRNASVTFVSSTPIANVGKFGGAGFFTPPPVLPALAEETQPTQANTDNAADKNREADPDAPPVVERKTIVEDDAFHQIRSKLFFKKGTEWKELGVGMLYLKPCGKTIQLLIRMEAVTGKVLLNINISKELPISRSGKNNVMVVSVPNPPVYAKAADGDNTLPCTYLIRVKGSTEADELFGKLKGS